MKNLFVTLAIIRLALTQSICGLVHQKKTGGIVQTKEEILNRTKHIAPEDTSIAKKTRIITKEVIAKKDNAKNVGNIREKNKRKE